MTLAVRKLIFNLIGGFIQIIKITKWNSHSLIVEGFAGNEKNKDTNCGILNLFSTRITAVYVQCVVFNITDLISVVVLSLSQYGIAHQPEWLLLPLCKTFINDGKKYGFCITMKC